MQILSISKASLIFFQFFNYFESFVGMGRIHYPADYPAGYPAGYPVAAYPVSGGKIGRIAGYRFCIIINYPKLKGSKPNYF